jgi:multiple sugar transport system permease protein
MATLSVGSKKAQKRFSLKAYLAKSSTRELIAGLLAISPWIIGFLAFTVFPLLASFYLSFTKYNLVRPPQWTGFANYLAMFQDERFIASVMVTSFAADDSFCLNTR